MHAGPVCALSLCSQSICITVLLVCDQWGDRWCPDSLKFMGSLVKQQFTKCEALWNLRKPREQMIITFAKVPNLKHPQSHCIASHFQDVIIDTQYLNKHCWRDIDNLESKKLGCCVKCKLKQNKEPWFPVSTSEFAKAVSSHVARQY